MAGPQAAPSCSSAVTSSKPSPTRSTTPFFFQIERNDIYDVSLGLRLLFAESAVVSVNALVPLNEDGLRADVIPTAQVEYTFSFPSAP